MAIQGLAIIGESLNDSIASTQKRYQDNDFEGLENLARSQDQAGATYIDINVGNRSAEFMAEMVKRIQRATAKPLSIDTPDPEIARAGLQAYDPDRAEGQKPILNSITQLREHMFDLYKVKPYLPMLMVTERVEDGISQPNRTAEQTYQTAKQLVLSARRQIDGISNDELIIDPGISPIGTDTEDNLKRLLTSLRLIQEDPDLSGLHMSVGLSNFTVMLPSKRADGSPVKGPLESAFITKAMPLGLDMIVGSTKRKHTLLPSDHPAMVCLDEVLRVGGFDAIICVRDFYAK